MKKTDNRLVEWAIREAESKYPGKVSVILNHNTYRLEKDRNIYFASHIIADGEPLEGLARTVMIDGIGYDFFQQPWKAYEKDAEAKGYYLTILADAEIVYCRSEADRQRFLYLREKLKANLADRDYMYQRGLEWLNSAMELYKNLLFETEISQIRKAAGYVADYLTVAVACLNQTYFKGNTRLNELRGMKHLPVDFVESYEKMAWLKTGGELVDICREMICSVRTHFGKMDIREPRRDMPDYEWLAEWYQECSYYFRRIYHACEQNNPVEAFTNCCWFQADLDEIAGKYRIPGLSISAVFDPERLNWFAEQVKAAEERIVSAVSSAGVKIDSYASIEEFLRLNP